MKIRQVRILAVVALCGLSACGGGGSGGGLANYATQFATLQASDVATITPEANLPTNTASYAGVASFNLSDPAASLIVYYGALDVDVNFAGDSLSGSISNFADIDQDAVSGSMTIASGVLTGTNTRIGDGLTASASGTVDGRSLNMDVTGHFFSDTGVGVALYFDEIGGTGIGTGLAVR